MGGCVIPVVAPQVAELMLDAGLGLVSRQEIFVKQNAAAIAPDVLAGLTRAVAEEERLPAGRGPGCAAGQQQRKKTDDHAQNLPAEWGKIQLWAAEPARAIPKQRDRRPSRTRGLETRGDPSPET